MDPRVNRLVCALAMVGMLSVTAGVAQPRRSIEVREPWQHQTLAAFVLERTFPVVSHGFLLAHLRTVTAATRQDAVFELSLKTGERRVVPFFLANAFEVHLETATIRADGHVLLGGSYKRSPEDTAEPAFVVEIAPTGEVLARFNLGEYVPERLCSTSDGGFWTFGQNLTKENAGEDYAFLRRYSSRGALVREYFQRSVLPTGVTLDYRARARNIALLSCGDASVAAYVGRGTPPGNNITPRFVWFEVNTSTGEARTMAVRNPGGASSITGLVLLSEGAAYASYSHGGLFQLTSAGSIGAWMPVPKATPAVIPPFTMADRTGGREFGVLLGRDGNSLVHLLGRLSPTATQTVYWSLLAN